MFSFFVLVFCFFFLSSKQMLSGLKQLKLTCKLSKAGICNEGWFLDMWISTYYICSLFNIRPILEQGNPKAVYGHSKRKTCMPQSRAQKQLCIMTTISLLANESSSWTGTGRVALTLSLYFDIADMSPSRPPFPRPFQRILVHKAELQVILKT